MKLLEVKDLRISFDTFEGKVQAVRGVSFDLDPKETLAIVGESGSGKTVMSKSILKMLSKNASLESGSIYFEGKDLLQLQPRSMNQVRGKDIAIIFQDPMTCLDPTMKIGKQILETILLHQRIPRKEARLQVLQLLNDVGIEEPKKRYSYYPHQFSGGQRQRIVIAIALANNPKLIIADEPTTALDVTMQAQILDLLFSLKEKYQTAIIFITHDLGVVREIADRVAVMYAGRIVEIGTKDEIFANSKHPYTWGLLSAVQANTQKGSPLYTIEGTPPDMIHLHKGDPFAPRNPYALDIDFEEEPPLFEVTKTHYAATWLLDPRAPKGIDKHFQEERAPL